MDQLSMTPARRQYAHHAYGRTADAFETLAWRPPVAPRFDGRPADDAGTTDPTLKELVADLPGWVTVVVVGVIAALMGALLGGALAL